MHRARNEQQSGKSRKYRGFRGKSPRKAWQVSPIRRQVPASHPVICGNFPDFSTTSLPGKSIFRDFSGRAAREKRLSTAIAPSTALRPRATCPTCHSGICHGFLSHRRGLLRGSVIFARPRKWWGASAVVAKCQTGTDNKGCGNHHKRSRPAHHCGSLPGLPKQIIMIVVQGLS